MFLPFDDLLFTLLVLALITSFIRRADRVSL
jgi:hypothetical protein